MVEVRKELRKWLQENFFVEYQDKTGLFKTRVEINDLNIPDMKIKVDCFVDFRRESKGARYCSEKNIDKETLEPLRAFKAYRDSIMSIEIIQSPQKAEIVQPTPSTAATAVQKVRLLEPDDNIGFIKPVANLDQQIAVFKLYEEAKTKLLSDADVLWIGADGRPAKPGVGHAHIKRSGWRKMARFFGLSCEIISRERIGTVKEYSWIYRVVARHPGGAYQHAEGVSSSNDKFFTKGGKVEAKEENVMLKAQTVAFNRAISDLLGGGEISAEEVES